MQITASYVKCHRIHPSNDHFLTMEVALGNMSETRRHSLHRHVTKALETIYQNDLPVSGVIARHFMMETFRTRQKLIGFVQVSLRRIWRLRWRHLPFTNKPWILKQQQ
jgi:hypothetical protein